MFFLEVELPQLYNTTLITFVGAKPLFALAYGINEKRCCRLPLRPSKLVFSRDHRKNSFECCVKIPNTDTCNCQWDLTYT